MAYTKAASVKDIPESAMKHVEIGGVDILLANVGGTFYAIDDRCGHMNAPLSMGKLEGDIVECPLHHARFDVKTGKAVRAPRISWLLKLTSAGKMMGAIKVRKRTTYPVRVEGDSIEVDIS